MKAWIVNKKHEVQSAVVFAETRGKAKSSALNTSCCEDVNFCDIEVSRAPQMDKYYTEGTIEMDWFDSQDRITLVKECGFFCEKQ